MKRTILFAALLALGACQTTRPPSNALFEQVRAARLASPAPALGVVVAACASGITFAQDGVTRLDLPGPLNEHARFNIGSNAKSMLATLAATFVEDGSLRWDTQVGDVFRVEAESLDPVLRQATLAQLLGHRSGLAAYDSGEALSAVEASGDTPSAQRLNFALQVLRSPPESAPGSAFRYSNAGYIVAGAMLERTGGKPFEQLMRERVFTPLRMNTATFGDPSPNETGQPLGHYTRDGVQTVYLDSEPAIPPFLQPAGDVSLSLNDYGRYLREHLCGLQGLQTQALTPQTIAFLHQPQGEDGTSLGWGRYAFGEVPASIHVGGTGVFSAYVAILPTRDLAVATVVNSGDADARAAALALMRSIIQQHLDTSAPQP